MDFKQKRKEFYEDIPDYWDKMYGQEYSLYDAHIIPQGERDKIKTTAKRIGHIFFKVCELLRNVNDETLIQMGFEEEMLEYIKIKSISAESVISRLDLVKVKDAYKVMEINSDTPTFIKELFYINGLITDTFDLINPNDGEEIILQQAVRSAVIESYETLNKEAAPNVVFTSHGESEEDTYTVKYLQELWGYPSKYVPLEELRIIEGEGLVDTDGDFIDVLYRQTFPIENLILDEDPETKEKVGLQLLDLVRDKKLAIVNPLSAFLLQTKAVQAVIWGLHEQEHPFFTEEEHGWINENFLATYLENDVFVANNMKYVKKPCFGREGDTVEIYDNSGKKIMEDKNKSYSDYLAVYQEYIDLPKKTFKTEDGEKEGHIMLGCFLLNGEPSAFGYRVGNRITDNLSYFLPVGVQP